MKKTILSLCVAVMAALAFIGCNKSSGGGEKTRVGGVNICDLDGNKFKKEMESMGRTYYGATLKARKGIPAKVTIVNEEIKGKLPTMDEYLEKLMKHWNPAETPSARSQVQSKTDSTATVSGTALDPLRGSNFGKVIRRVFRDEAKNSFIIVTGWYLDDDIDKAAVESCVNSAEL